MKNKYLIPMGVISALLITSCSSSGTSSGDEDTDTAVAVTSLDEIPSVDSMVSGTEANSLTRLAVSGTAPLLTEIGSDDLDTYFWDGTLATINGYVDASSVTGEDRDNYFNGEGACFMAQMTGYSFQDIMQNGASLCYMRNAPTAASGVSITSGDAEAETLFDQDTENRTVKVSVSDPEFGDQTIFIRVYGTESTEGSDGYAADLWFCQEGQTGAPTEYEQIRVNTSTGEMTQSSYHSREGEGEEGGGTFAMTFAATLTETDGEISFDPTGDRTASMFGQFGQGSFVRELRVTGDGEIYSKEKNDFEDSSSMRAYVISTFTGDSVEDLRFSSAGFAMNWGDDYGSFSGGLEFQDTHYVFVESGDLFDATSDYDFEADDFYTSEVEPDAELVSAAANYDCGETADVEVSMDMSDAGMIEVQELCENRFEGMDFCYSEEVDAARNRVFESYMLEGEGEGEI